MPTKADVYTLLFNWLKSETGLTVIRANQKGPRPARPYVSLNFLNPSSRLGASVDQQWVNADKTVSTEGMRKAVASINIFGENAIDTLARVRDSLDRPDVVAKFDAAGVTHLDDGQINDLTELQETIYEERGQMDLTVAFVASGDVDVSTIEHVNLSGDADGNTVTTTVN